MAQKTGKPSADQRIDESLKRVYDAQLQEQVPDKFLELIAKLKSAEGSQDHG
ncbi:MAG: NepR family anti-sigma factor [Pseudomonadota bacterium]